VSKARELLRLAQVHLLKTGSGTRPWSEPGAVNQPRLEGGGVEAGYFLDFSADSTYAGPFDADGVPLIDYGTGIGVHYNPWYVGHHALAVYQKFSEEGDSGQLEQFMRQVAWFKRTAERSGDSAVWSYRFGWLGIEPPWISGLAQGYAISTLVRAYVTSGDEEALDLAWRAHQPMVSNVEAGGLLHTADGWSVIEEYPRQKPWHVLNGHLFAIFGLYELWEVTGDGALRLQLDRLGAEMAAHLAKYDTGWWSLYGLNRARGLIPNVASPHYHRVHIAQLAVMARLFGHPEFETFRDRWSGYAGSRRRLAKVRAIKIGYKVLL
jgi:heparosan-N-sulfate-glucuronate 5-epimerase